jgi:hypothetical protein
MKFFESYTSFVASNDEQGFIMPYSIYGAYDRLRMEFQYYRLSNYSNNPLVIRCNGLAYGGREQNQY